MTAWGLFLWNCNGPLGSVSVNLLVYFFGRGGRFPPPVCSYSVPSGLFMRAALASSGLMSPLSILSTVLNSGHSSPHWSA